MIFMKMRIVYNIFTIAILFFATASTVFAASLSVSPSSGNFEVGKNFSVNFVANTSGSVMNASSGSISFPATHLEVVSISKTGSIFSLWVQEPVFSNTAGTINFEGVVLNPGYNGPQGKLLTATFRVKKEGSALIKFNTGAVLANDGFGTNLASTFNSATYTLGPAVNAPIPTTVSGQTSTITSETHPDGEEWYNTTTAVFSWNIPTGTIENRILIGRNANSTPTVIYNPPISTKTIEDLGEGTYYFSVQNRTNAGWGGVTRFKLNIDTKAPEEFNISVDALESSPKLNFETSDVDSGFSHYEVRIGDSNPIRIDEQKVSGFDLGSGYSGLQTVFVKAFDKAGNSREVEVSVVFPSEALGKPSITEYPLTIEQGELITLQGLGTAGSIVELTFTKKGQSVSVHRTQVDENGEWSIVVTSTLGWGNYVVSVEATSPDESLRLPGYPIALKITPHPLLGFAIQFVGYLAVAILVVIGLASFIKIVMYFSNDIIRTIRFLKHHNKKEERRTVKENPSPLSTLKNKKFF